MPRNIPEKFLVAFSFAGEQRDLVRSIAEAVEGLLGHGSVFFDEWFEYYIAGDNADLRLQDIYHNRAKLVVPCVSEHYESKEWTGAEYKAIRGLQLKLEKSADKRDPFRILPLRVGDGDVKGIFENTICPDVRKKSVPQAAELIFERLGLVAPIVYVAQCNADSANRYLSVYHRRLRAFLVEIGCIILPLAGRAEKKSESLIEEMLKQCSAFVQLLGPCAEKEPLDRIESDTAAALGIRRFRHRSPELDLTKVDQEHLRFITERDVIVNGFEDFKDFLSKQLNRLPQLPGGNEESTPRPPLVRVMIRSAATQDHEEAAFRWIHQLQNMRFDLLNPEETFSVRHTVEPCHGFMVMCDAQAQESASPQEAIRAIMIQCSDLQLAEKNGVRRPPVALVYWPPPEPKWSRLLKTTPPKLVCVLGNEPERLGEFFAEVRRVAG